MGVGIMGALSPVDLLGRSLSVPAQEGDGLSLKMAGYDYQRITPFFDQKVKIEGCSHTIEKAGVGDMNISAFGGPQTYDVSELGIVPYILAWANDGHRDYSLIPVFPLRVFRHKSIFIHADSDIKSPADLKGKRIGTPGYSSSSLVWIRGMLRDEYGVKPEDIDWVIARKDSSADVSGKVSKQEQQMPDGISISYGPEGMDESELLLQGEVDALFHAVQPKAFVQGNPKVVRLFSDSKNVEQAYYQKTGIFPIMHAIGVRKSLLDEHPWLAAALFNAYSEAKTMNYKYMTKLAWAYESLPWFAQEFEETKRLMGQNFWSYGMEANRKVMETICRYMYEENLIKEQVSAEDLFHPSSLGFSE